MKKTSKITLEVHDSNDIDLLMQLAKRLHIKAKIEEDEENEYWNELSKKGLERAYSEDEPEYSLAGVKEPNPNYTGCKKDK